MKNIKLIATTVIVSYIPVLIAVLCIFVYKTAYTQGERKGLETARQDFVTAQQVQAK